LTILVNGIINWIARQYQLPFLAAMAKGIKRAVLVFHRRSGKTITLLNYAIGEMTKRSGITVYHCFPTYSEAIKVIWHGQSAGKKYLSYFPEGLVKKINHTEHWVEFWNGSRYQLIGSDNYDALAGTNPNIVILDEYSLQDPDAYNLIFSPILVENKGIAIFAFTPRGKNHAWEVLERAKINPDWFHQVLTIDDTRREDGTPVISPEDIAAVRAEGRSEAQIQQEFYCSFEGAVDGAYYSLQLSAARESGRIGMFPHVTNLPVYTFWDLGFNDSMSIWFVQRVGQEIRHIDFYHNRQHGFDHYAKILKDKPYTYFEHYMPHDSAVHDISAPGKLSRKDVAEQLGIKPIKTVERPQNRAAVMAGIEAVRSVFSQCTFDENNCKYGLSALAGYHADYDEKKMIIEDSPVHDWCSHPADAERTMATSDFLEIKEDTPWKGLKSKGSWKN